MHPLSYSEMAVNIGRHFERLLEGAQVMDVGSQDVNGSYRGLIESRWKYIGIDLTSGRNVDHVMSSEFDIGLPDGCADAVISGQCLEHCRNPFRLMAEIVKIAKHGAPILITAPCVGWGEHRYPYDCWRFFPDGMRTLLEQSSVDCVVPPYTKRHPQNTVPIGQVDRTDCWGIGRKI